MFKNYWLIAWRNLRRNKGYSFINVAGLGLGMAITLIIGLWIADERSFDSYHENYHRIAEVMTLQAAPHEPWSTSPITTTAAGQAVHHHYDDLFEKTTEVSFSWDHLIAAGDKTFSRPGVWAQEEFPAIFSYKMIHGSASGLKDPSTFLISQSLATALFGKTDPTGKIVKLDNELNLAIGGVFADLPDNTTYHNVDLLLPWDNPSVKWLNTPSTWDNHSHQQWVQLRPKITPEQATARIGKLPTEHLKGWREELMVYPLDQLHLYGNFTNAKADGGRIDTVRLFGIIGGFVLLLACINFMNLSTARSEKRAKEVGIRKTIGSLKSQLIGQFLGESVLVAFLSLILCIGLTFASLPLFNRLTVKDMHLPWTNPFFGLSVLAFTLVTGLLAGSYPAFYLSGFKPVKVLKGVFKAGRAASLPRQVLVVLQFTVSLTLIIGTIIVYRQVQFTEDRPVGYDRAGLITVGINTADLQKNEKVISTHLLRSALVAGVAESSYGPSGFWTNTSPNWEGKKSSQNTVFFRNVNVTPEFGKTIGWKIVQGRDFSRDFATDSDAVILNDTASKFIGFKDPIGKTITYGNKRRTIIGVVANMVTNSPYAPVEPAMFLGDGRVGVFTIRLKAGQSIHAAIAGIELIFKKYNPGSPFLYTFNDDDYARKFENEQRTGNLALIFASFAIFISCLGLFGLAAFVAEQRTKEIGVRKILGAGVVNLWGLLSKNFLKLTALSLFIAIPLAYYGMGKWLAGYTYHTPMSWWIFAVAGAGILLITLLTVSWQALKAALMNPVKSLRAD